MNNATLEVSNNNTAIPLIINTYRGGETVTVREWSLNKFLLRLAYIPSQILVSIYGLYKKYARKVVALGEISTITKEPEYDGVENLLMELLEDFLNG